MIEIWKPVRFYHKYDVSNLGRVRNFKKDKLMTIGETMKGYKKVKLCQYNKPVTKSLHRLVLEAFNPVQGMWKLDINHIDGDKSNNNLSNLEWCTRSENAQHAFNLGLRKHGKRSVICQEKIGNGIWVYESIVQAHKNTGVTKDRIVAICNNKASDIDNLTFSWL